MLGDVFYTDNPYVTVLGAEITVEGDDVPCDDDMALGGEITLGGELKYEDEELALKEEEALMEGITLSQEADTVASPVRQEPEVTPLSVQEEVTTTSETTFTNTTASVQKVKKQKSQVNRAVKTETKPVIRPKGNSVGEGVGDTAKRGGRRKDIGIIKNMKGEINSRFCTTCGIAFTSGLALRVHRAAHARERNQCPLCSAVFCWNSNLSRHIRYKHTGHKPFTCDVCQAAFSESGNLIRHKKVHSDEKPYQCDICGARHREKFNLKRHKRTHERQGAQPRVNRREAPETSTGAKQVPETMIIKCINNM